jgi:hypothetical protein
MKMAVVLSARKFNRNTTSPRHGYLTVRHDLNHPKKTSLEDRASSTLHTPFQLHGKRPLTDDSNKASFVTLGNFNGKLGVLRHGRAQSKEPSEQHPIVRLEVHADINVLALIASVTYWKRRRIDYLCRHI